MKLNERAMAQALTSPDPAVRLYFLYGPDDAASRALAARLEDAMGTNSERIDLDGAMLKDDPARLADEAAAFSLFGGRRYIRVIGGEECAEAVAALLEAPVTGNPAVMIAGALKPTSALVKLALAHPAVLACISYKPDAADAETLAVQIGRGLGLRLGPGVAARLAANCLSDRAVLTREIEKLALFVDAAPDRPREADESALDAIGAELAEADTSALVNAVMSGDLPAVAHELNAVDADNHWIPALRALQRRLILLARLRGEVDRGKSPSAVTSAMGKALFYKDQAPVTAQLTRWPSARLATASSRLLECERALMASGTAGHVIAAEELTAIARVAARLR